MKKKTLEKWVLLEQSGELSSRKTRKLDASPDAQRLRDELNTLCEVLPLDTADPSPWATTEIKARLRDERCLMLLPARVWTPIVALAACLTLVVGVWDLKTEATPISASVVMAETDAWNAQFDQELIELENLISNISSDSLNIMEM